MVVIQIDENMTAEVDQRGKKLKRFDVTETQAYKDLYANNLRMYSFLMTKVRYTCLLGQSEPYM